MKNNKQLRYIAYVRKSEEREDRQLLSHEAQETEIKANFTQLKIVKWMEAESKSAFKTGRPIFDEMMAMIERGEADGIVAWHPNRLSRNEIDSARITYMLRDKLKDLQFCSYNFDNSAEGIMMLQMVMNQSQYESSKQGRDVKRGMKQKASNGERPGPVPPGYIKVPVLNKYGDVVLNKDKVVTETKNDPERYELVQKMWSMLLGGRYNAAQIRRIANDEWHFITRKTEKIGGVPLSSSMIYNLFNNPFYAGWMYHNGDLYEGGHNKMITMEEFDYAQKLLGKKGKPRKGVYQYAFAGLIKCGVCGCSVVSKTVMKYVKDVDTTKTYTYHYCTRKSDKRPCNQSKYTTLDVIEKQIDEELGKYTILPEFQEMALKILQRNNKTEVKDRNQIYQSCQKRRDTIQNQLDKLVDMLTRGLLDEDEYKEQRNKLKVERSEVDNQLRSTEANSDKWMELTEKIFDFATYARIRFQDGDIMTKRDILMTLGENLTLLDGKLIIIPNEWLIPIAEHYPELEKRYLWVRTNQKASPTVKEEAMESIFELWRARWDLNPRHSA